MLLSCLVLGDSIAVGTQIYKPYCEVHAKVGINSYDWNRHWLTQDISADKVIISLGSNDWSANVTRRELEKLRSHITAKKVIWLIPAIKPVIRSVVESIALANGDGMIDLLSIPRGSDGIHPTATGYREIGRLTN
jgi:lysophospholipase L1-like esterase